MKTAPPALLALPAGYGARWLALTLLEDAAAARERLPDGSDADALHDFRVALRRVRSTLRAYRPELGDAVSRGDRRRLRRLARASGETRDRQVQRERVAALLDGLDPAERPGAEWLLSTLAPPDGGDGPSVDRALGRRFAKARRRLAGSLAVYPLPVETGPPGLGAPLGEALAARVGAAAEELQARLGAVRTREDQEPAHRARIAGKRLRYLLEPFAGDRRAGTVLRDLKRLQDLLGDMNDAAVLRGTVAAALDPLSDEAEPGPTEGDGAEPAPDPRPGLKAVDAAMAALLEHGWEELRKRWLDGGAVGFLDRVEVLRRALAPAARPAGAVEIERKFLLRRFPRVPKGARVRVIDQGWIPGERLHERLRRVREDGQERFYRTVKLGEGIRRTELEEETTRDVFRRLWSLTKGKRVSKRRYVVADGALAWEVDRFTDRRLVLAEVELPHEGWPVELPPWLRRELVREVTGEPEYVNLNLAR